MSDPRRTERPSTLNEEILDAEIRHGIKLERLSGGIANDIIEQIREGDKELEAAVIPALPDIVEEENSLRLNGIERQIEENTNELYEDIRGKLRSEMRDVAEYETEYSKKKIGGIMGIAALLNLPSGDKIDDIVNKKIDLPSTNNPNKSIDEWVESMGEARKEKWAGTIRKGFQDGEVTAGEIETELLGGGSVRGQRRRAEDHASAVSRTATFQAAAGGMGLFVSANRGYFRGVQWISVLDERTTPYCAGQDGKIYREGQGPRPPAHMNCRSQVIPVTRPADEWPVAEDKVPPDVRRKATGQAVNEPNYREWLDNQPYYVVEQTLGVERAKLYAHGGLDFQDLTNSKGEFITLNRLKQLEEEAVERAEDAVTAKQLKQSQTLREKHFG